MLLIKAAMFIYFELIGGIKSVKLNVIEILGLLIILKLLLNQGIIMCLELEPMNFFCGSFWFSVSKVGIIFEKNSVKAFTEAVNQSIYCKSQPFSFEV